MSSTDPLEVIEPDVGSDTDAAKPWIVLVWNDPINLMSYVAFVLQKLFGYSKGEAEQLMMQVHVEGKAVVSNGSRSDAERDVFRLHEHGLWATMQQD
ncbi:MAG: ATP-dependent Clp protease adapter ClpS [Microthrixaceae bacterium]